MIYERVAARGRSLAPSLGRRRRERVVQRDMAGMYQVQPRMIGGDVMASQSVLNQYVLNGLMEEGLGFSLKPPRWLRKAKPLKFLLPAAAIGASLFIPGVGPALAAAGKFVGGSVARGAMGLGREVAHLFHAAPRLPKNSLKAILQEALPAAAPRAIPVTSVQTFTPDQLAVPAQTFATTAGSPPEPTTAADETSDESSQAPAKAGTGGANLPLLIGGAAVLLLASGALKGRRGRSR